jgi:peptidoglycan-N-acetylglucosamine deacetylase
MGRSPRPRLWLLALGALVALVGLSVLVVRLGGGASQASGRGVLRSVGGVPAPDLSPAAARARRERAAMAAISMWRQPVYRGSERRRLVALTFDDGPGPDTMRILGTLNRLGVPATFFVVGRQIAGHERELAAVVAHGGAIGVHTWDHRDLTRLRPAQVRAEVLGTRNAIRAAAGSDPALYRPPYGAVDAHVMADVAAGRMVPVLWDCDGEDWREDATPRSVARAILREVRPGSIILLHDGGGRRVVTARALPAIVRGLRARHLTPVLVTDLLRRDPPPRDHAAPARTTAPDGRAVDAAPGV